MLQHIGGSAFATYVYGINPGDCAFGYPAKMAMYNLTQILEILEDQGTQEPGEEFPIDDAQRIIITSLLGQNDVATSF